ncbi:MAG: TFIIB-type zinc ribbon-containing protein, partial [Brachybacterium sp.]|nr:TFIIB-type zinc ribbon-containing protein [Brachybacterium sp.]
MTQSQDPQDVGVPSADPGVPSGDLGVSSGDPGGPSADPGAPSAAGGPDLTKDRVLDTSSGRADGLIRCPRCGSTESRYSIDHGALICAHCRNAWNEPLLESKLLVTDIGRLRGTVTGSGAGAIENDEHILTLKCQGCGAEVVITTDRQLQARCHWCRQVLSVSTQIPNGAVPDGVLPFTITHAEALTRIREFVGKRSFFAWRRFRQEFTPDNVVGVYMPYMLIDGNLIA